jgi:hypothetical protein
VADLTQTRRRKAKAREIRRRESLVRTARTRPHIISLTNALLQIKSFDANKKKKQEDIYIILREKIRQKEQKRRL